MNKSVPTLLGIVIILLVVMLVVLVFNYKLTQQLGTGATVVGTQSTKTLTGVTPPMEEISPSEVLGAQKPQVQPKLSPALQPGTRASKRAMERGEGTQRGRGRAGRAREEAKPGGK